MTQHCLQTKKNMTAVLWQGNRTFELRCRCKIRYVSKFAAASCASPCDSTAFVAIIATQSCLFLLWTNISFFASKNSLFVLLPVLTFSFICVLFFKHTQFNTSWLFSELIRTQQGVTLFGPACSSPAIWSVIFQVLHFSGLAFSVAPRGWDELPRSGPRSMWHLLPRRCGCCCYCRTS